MKAKQKKNILPGAALAALLAAVIVYCIMLNVEKNTMRAYEKETVIAASRNISGGTVITPENLSEYFKEIEMDKKLIPQTSITDREELNGMMVSTNIDMGSVITNAMIENKKEMIASMNHPVIAGFKAEDLYQVVSGTLRGGDRIHIYTVDEESDMTYMIWENVMVDQVFDSAGTAIAPDNETAAAQRINILMEQEDTERFYSELSAGSLRVVKAVR